MQTQRDVRCGQRIGQQQRVPAPQHTAVVAKGEFFIQSRAILASGAGGAARGGSQPPVFARQNVLVEVAGHHRLVFFDETFGNTAMTRLYGWGPTDQRVIDFTPHGHWKTTTFVAAFRHDGLFAPMVVDGPLNGRQLRRDPAIKVHPFDVFFDSDCTGDKGKAALFPRHAERPEGHGDA